MESFTSLLLDNLLLFAARLELSGLLAPGGGAGARLCTRARAPHLQLAHVLVILGISVRNWKRRSLRWTASRSKPLSRRKTRATWFWNWMSAPIREASCGLTSPPPQWISISARAWGICIILQVPGSCSGGVSRPGPIGFSSKTAFTTWARTAIFCYPVPETRFRSNKFTFYYFQFSAHFFNLLPFSFY